MEDVWFVFCTMGELNLKDILAECQSQGWVPVLIVRTKENVLIPCFPNQELAIKFAKRNLPKTQLWGTTLLTAEDMIVIKKDWVEKRGWKIEHLDHPRLMKNLGSLDVEVYEFQDKPDVYGVWGNRCQHSKLLAQGETV